jgi:predicted  nucleic acid-binding Zn-ribbon protein
MKTDLSVITNDLRAASEQYNVIIVGKKFDYNDWKKNCELLAPIVEKLSKRAKAGIDQCEKEIASNNQQQKAALDKRAALYEKLEAQKKKLSDLDVRKLAICAEISATSREIEDINKEIQRLQGEIAKKKKENEDWNTAFYATCWIPFVNIGMGVKKHYEDGECQAAIKVKGKDIANKQDRINKLNDELRAVTDEQSRNNESSNSLANQITAVEGEISVVTIAINDLRNSMGLWQTILTACNEIGVQLQHVSGKIEIVMDCFARLFEVGELLVPPATDKYIMGCRCKGDRLATGQRLGRNEYLLSPNKRFVAVMQSDNNFVVYNSERPLWDSQTWGATGNGYIELGADGRVSLRGTNRVWDTKREGVAILVMQDDGNLVAYTKDNKPLWASDTYTYAFAPGICFNEH